MIVMITETNSEAEFCGEIAKIADGLAEIDFEKKQYLRTTVQLGKFFYELRFVRTEESVSLGIEGKKARYSAYFDLKEKDGGSTFSNAARNHWHKKLGRHIKERTGKETHVW